MVGHFFVVAPSLGKDIGANQEVGTAQERGGGCHGRLGLENSLKNDSDPTAQRITGDLYGFGVARTWDLDHVKTVEAELVQDIAFVLLTPPD